MSLTIGTRIGPYEIKSPLGEGGMGVVYRASDTKLRRDVAIKLLPEHFAGQLDRLSWFQREAQVLAALNHPNIAQIYGLEESDDTRCIVMELVEGETLADRLKRGPILLQEALSIAVQIATALEAAHEKGIIHRDLKPANVKLTTDGSVKVLDFGLAKTTAAESSDPNMSHSPTMVSVLATEGMILGTAAYMSPEQASGKPIDRRTDLWAFGVVLLEMLTGKPVFAGETVSHVMAAVLMQEPDWTLLPPDTPESVRKLIRRCLEKDRRKRLPDAGVVRLEVDEALQAPTQATQVVQPRPQPVRHPLMKWMGYVVMGGMIVALAIPAVRHLRESSPAEMRVEINTPLTLAPAEFALSPDGRYIAFIASGDGAQRLWLRPLDKTEAQPISGTDGANSLFWSGDSRSIGFFGSGRLYRIDIAGGRPQALANTPVALGGAWNTDGVILFSTNSTGPLFRTTASGGEPVAVTHVIAGQVGHRLPQFLPDGRHFLFFAPGTSEASGLYLGSLDGGEPKRLTAADSQGAYLEPDLVIFVAQGTLLGRRLDIAKGELTGDPLTIAGPAGLDVQSAFSVAHGRVAYRSGSYGRLQLAWFDRNGKPLGVAGEPDVNSPSYPELSPDGRRVALTRVVQGNMDIFLMDLLRGGGLTRLTFDPASDTNSVWSPDGMHVAFTSNRNGTFNMYMKASSGVGADELLFEGPNITVPQDWSKDGRFLLYYEVNSKTGRDLWAMRMDGKERKTIPVTKTPFDENIAQFSPDGRWVAYQTSESGRFEIRVQTFPEPTGKWQISSGGGVQPRWRADGKELYFIAPDGKLMAAPVMISNSAFEPGTPVALFQTRIVMVGAGGTLIHPQYTVSADGRFLINQPVEESTATPITLILNWKPRN